MRFWPILLGVGAFVCATSAGAEDERTAAFTTAQADHGQEVYNANCAVCHGANLENPEFAPSLEGAAFRRRWGGQSVGGLFAYVSGQMPPGQTGILAPDDYAAILAYLIRANGGQAGAQALPSDPSALADMTFPGG